MFCLSANQTCPTICSTSPMGISECTLGTSSCRFCLTFPGKHFSDAYSKWLEVKLLSTANSVNTIEHLRSIFATRGVFVTDNSVQFTSSEFELYMKNSGIQHIKSAPYHPASNGLAERAVQVLKGSMKCQSGNDTLETRISKFLLWYRIIPLVSHQQNYC